MRIYEQKQHQIQKKRWILFQLSFDTQLVTQSSWALTMQNRCIGSMPLILNECLTVPSRNKYLEGYSLFVIFLINLFYYFSFVF